MKPVRSVAVAFALSAALIVLQTVIFQLLPWDSSVSSKVTVVVRVGFLIADLMVVVSLVALARASSMHRGLSVCGAALASFSVLSDVFGLAASALGSSAETLHELSRATSGAEPVLFIGATLLATFALGALAEAHGPKAISAARLVRVAVSITVAVSLGFRIVRLFDSGARSLPAAWTSWLIEITRPALVAWLAFSLLNAVRRTNAEEAKPAGPYRAAAEGAPVVVRKELLDTATIASLEKVARGLSSYRIALLARMGAAVATMFVVVIVGFMLSNGGVTFVIMPLASLATGVLLVVSLVKVLALPRGLRAKGPTVIAILALCLAGLLDAATLLFAISMVVGSSSYRAAREISEMSLGAWPVVALASGLSILQVARVLARLGDGLANELVTRRASWVQGLAVGAGATLMGVLFASVALGSARYSSSSAGSGWLVVIVLALAAFVSTLSAVIAHVLLVGSARASLIAEISAPPRAG